MSVFYVLLLEYSWIHVTFVTILLTLLVYGRLSAIIKRLWEIWIIAMVPRDAFPNLPLPPGTLGYPLVGETITFLRKRSDFYKEKYEKYGPIYKTHILFSPTVRVVGAQNVKKILLSENTLVESCWPRSAQLLLGPGSITQATGFEHRVRRRHLLHALCYDALDDMAPIMQRVVRSYLQDWCTRGELLAYPECKSLAFATAACALLGTDTLTAKQTRMHTSFIDLTNNIMSIPLDLPGFGFRKGMKAKQTLIKMLQNLLPQTEKRYTRPILQVFRDSCGQLSYNSEYEVYEGILDIMFASHETIASATTSCIMFLGKHKNVREKLREELQALCSGTMNMKTVNDVKYLDYVMKEVLRLCPPAGAGYRKVIKSFELGGYLIPRGWTVLFSIRETQHLSPIFHNGESFDPDRWESLEATSDKGGPNPERFHFIPFGFGSRGCVGKGYAQLMIKVFLAELVRTCDWDLKNENIEMEYIPIPKATDDLPVKFRERPENTN